MPSLIEIGSVVLEKKMKMWEVYDNANNNNDNNDDSDNDGQRTNFDQKSSLGPLAQGAKNQVDVNVNNEQINIEYHTLLRGGSGPSP